MKIKHWTLLGLIVISSLAIGQAVVVPPPLLNIAQSPLFARASLPPLNMLVMGKDHKIYYEAYNDASDLDGDGVPDVGYQGWQTRVVDGQTRFKIDYFGYFNSFACYTWDGAKFNPVSASPNKTCSGQWSGDYLNYLTTSRMDALRRVLYGGWRQVDTATETVLQGSFFPQDAHSWGKEYQSVARDGYNIASYTPLSAPTAGNYHLFAVTTVTDNSAPLFRVMQNSPYRVWNWLSIEGPVAGNKCFTSGNSRVDCVTASSTWNLVPAGTLTGLTLSTWRKTGGSPADRAGMNTMFSTYAVAARLCGTGAVTNINKTATNNPFTGNSCGHDNYISRITGTLNITTAGSYRFAIDGDDAVDLTIDGTPVVGWYGGHGASRTDASLTSHSGTINLGVGVHTIEFRHEESTGDDSWGLFWENAAGSNRRDDYAVRVSVCPDTEALRDTTCKAYPNGHYKPTGILHDYGESERMYFGLITGSQQNNLQGGKLRRNVGNFANEITANTGQFRTDVNGIARSIDKLRMIGGAYNSGTNNLDADSNWNWANGNGNCAGTGDEITNGNCRMWGNPIAEMMYEAMRYFAGAAAATPEFATGGSANGTSEETAMGLTTDTWKDPYKTAEQGGLGYATCANPFQTVISDINPSYDGDLPGAASTFAAVAPTGVTPANINGFSASGQGDAIWNHEFPGGARNVFIGEVGGATDGAPTAKSASSFGNIRGLAPEEPTKNGTYYSGSVARFGRITDINAAANEQKLSTYSIALASPLPRIEVPVGTAGQKITLVPFAKTVSGTFGGGTRKPTNTIVDFYIQQLANFPGQTRDNTVNGGLPRAVFRINYEDVEQGNDHDMDTIARYEVNAKTDGTVDVQVISEYAAGSANQYMGYVLSGSNADGIYLEICDLRDGIGNPGNSTDRSLCASTDTRYRFNTPPGRAPGYCTSLTPADCAGLPPTSNVRNFSAGTSSTTQLMDPLWYAAKYGGFTDTNGNLMPDGTEWDADANGVPDNYFLVTNPLNLRSQLTKAFDAIEAQDGASGTINITGARVNASSYAVLPSYNSAAGGHDWTGDLTARNIGANGQLSTTRWSAAARMPNDSAGVANRDIFTALSNVNSTNRTTAVQPFRAANLGATNVEIFNRLGSLNPFGDFGSITPNQMVEYLRGERGMEGSVMTTRPFRQRSGILGDIINSTPMIASKTANYGWASASGLTAGQRTAYSTFVTAKAAKREFVYVGANDGMLHAFDDAGREEFAYIPNGVLGNMAWLANRNYTHRYYVDGAITLSDALISGSWKSVLVGAAGAGGRTVFALDINAPAAFSAADVLWEVNSQTDADMGYVMGKPLIVPADNGRWVAIFGNGYNSQNGNPVLFVVDIATGAVVRKLAPDDLNTTTANGLGNVSAVDTDRDGLVDTVYGGDLLGNVWKFDIGGTSETSWNVALGGLPLFVATDTAGNRQPITGSFEVAVGPGTGYMLYFGTGRYFVNGDNNGSVGQQVQSLYGVWDNGTGVPTNWRTTQLLVAQQITAGGTTPETRNISRNPVSYLAKRGWYLDLIVGGLDTGERFIANPRIQSGKVYLPTYQPGITSGCAPGGKNWLYALDPLSGGAAFGQITLPPNGTVGGPTTGGVATGEGAPSRDVGVTQPVYVPPVFCTPGSPSCPLDETTPPSTTCSEVIIDASDPTKSLVVQRACGRQSWRQLL